MTQQFLDDDDPQFAATLRGIEADAAPVDGSALNRIREMLLQEVAASAATEASPEMTETHEVVTDVIRPVTSAQPERGDTTVTLTRVANEPPRRSSLLSAVVVAAVLLAAAVSLWVTQQTNSVTSPMALASVLDEVAMADSLRIEAIVSGGKEEILVKQPSKARWQIERGRYRLLDGTRLWHVDESENTAQLEPPLVQLAQGTKSDKAHTRISVLGLLGIETQRRDLVRALPVKQEEIEGLACSFYDATVPALIGGDVAGDVRIEAVVETQSRRVRSLTVWPAWRGEGQRAPLADIQLLAINEPVNEAQFVLAKSLSQDGRIGKISDTQGVVTLRPALHERWTPVCQQMLLKPGDSLRTDLRGPNAVQVTLTSEVQITLGPGALVECVSPFEVRLLGGELQVKFPTALEREFKLAGPKGQSARWDAHSKKDGAAHEAIVVRLSRDEKLTELKTKPAWLSGFEGAMVGDKLGALIANVDGRNEPLTIGYHKVNVEIRDQIARTTIEESFVNHTGGRLEGVFHFPLPSDASISGFGMWIGHQLVEADIVEKQRAREIFETILRERRDPGLLEWTAGNLFKARVFPIEPHSEKRIKIVYTQVLPLRGNRFRYSYGLQSDLLRQHPVRDLAIDVLINSTLPISRIECPTHDVQTRYGHGHSSHVTFNAREYVPTRDFEVVCQLDGPRNDVVVTPHQRGDDGYLLVQITPPSTDGNWQREILPNGKPVELLLLCDTSGSMDSGKRQQQAEFIAALLSSLGEKDRFNLAGCDVNCVWVFGAEKSVPATAANIETARKFLNERGSLGWTDLERAFAAVHEKANDGAQIVYVGDGIVTARDANPQAFAGRLAEVVAGSRKKNETGGTKETPEKTHEQETHATTFHAVAVGNTVETVVLKAIAATSGGSMRAIGGELTAQKVALELLNEIAQPGLRDVQIEFRGVPVAAVYPSKLPNLAAGTQQMVLARYLPGGVAGSSTLIANQKKMPLEVVVTGKRGNESVRFVAKTNFAEAEEGNSFIPRLWARLHLDQLLSQGKSKAIQDEIIRLSEEFHIITPYTSLLVLESDADRERFGVKRRYEMRDGERFFADGRDNAKYELRQQYMAAERAWRESMRRAVLKKLATLGRDPQIQRRLQQYQNMLGDFSGMSIGQQRHKEELFVGESFMLTSGGMGFGGGMGGGIDDYSQIDGLKKSMSDSTMLAFDSDSDALFDIAARSDLGELDSKRSLDRLERLEDEVQLSQVREFNSLPEDARAAEPTEMLEFDGPYGGLTAANRPVAVGARGGEMYRGVVALRDGADYDGLYENGRVSGYYLTRAGLGRQQSYYERPYNAFNNVLRVLVPELSHEIPISPDSGGSDLWKADALALSKKLSRRDSLTAFLKTRGLEVKVVTQTMDKRWSRTVSRTETLNLIGGSRWLTRPLTPGSHDIVNWCDPKERGVFSNVFGLGQVRKPEAFEPGQSPLTLLDYSLSRLHDDYQGYTATLVKVDDNVSNIEIAFQERVIVRVAVNTRDAVVLRVDHFEEGHAEPRRSLVFSDFVDVAGRKWARKTVETSLGEDDAVSETTHSYAITEHDGASFTTRFNAESAGRANVELIRLPLPSVVKAKSAIAAKKATLEDRLVVLRHFAASQQWALVFEQLEGLEALPVKKGSAGREWLRTLVLKMAGRNEETRQRLLAAGKTLVESQLGRHDFPLATTIHNEAYNILNWDEYARLMQLLKPVFDRQLEETDAKSHWQAQWINCLRSLGRHDELRSVMAERIKAQPWDYGQQVQFANDIAATGDFEAARKFFIELRAGSKWITSERRYLRDSLLGFLRNQQRRTLVVEMLEQELASGKLPEDEHFYVMYLSELLLADQEAKAHELMRQWMREARVDDLLSSLQHAHLNAALRLANGNGDGIYSGRFDERFAPDFVALAKHFARHKDLYGQMGQILSSGSFGDSDEVIKLRGEWFGFLKASLHELRAGHLGSLVGWCLPNEPQTTREDWISIAAAIKDRWRNETAEGEKHALGAVLEQIYSQRLSETHLLPFLREQLAAAKDQFRENDRRRLFDALLRAKWSIEIEREAMTLLPQLGEIVGGQGSGLRDFEIGGDDAPVANDDSAPPMSKSRRPDPVTHDVAFQIISLQQFVDRMLAARQEAAMTALLATGHPEKLTRTQYAQQQAEFLKVAREGVSAALRLARTERKERHELESWMTLERGYIDLQLGRDPAPVLAEAWAILGESPVEQTESTLLTMPLLKQRAFVVIMNLTCRRTATEADIKRLLKYLDSGIATKPKNSPQQANAQEEDDFDVEAATWQWKKAKFDLLIALDRPEALEHELERWIKSDSSVAPWRKSLARLKAERGDIKAAIELLETVRRNDELLPAEHATLAKWYLASDRRADYEHARIAYWKTMPEHQINNALQNMLQPYHRHDQPRPSTLDENVLFALRAIFEKSNSPGSYLYRLREFYDATRDFRLMGMLAETVVGKTPQQVYSVLHQVSGQVLVELRDEATSDELLKGIRLLREQGASRGVRSPLAPTEKGEIASSLSPVDLRALDLLEALVERKASEVLNQPGPHVAVSLAALRRAFDREWASGEQRQMADLLAALGVIAPQPLADEQVRQLNVLAQQAAVGRDDHLFITAALARAMTNYGQRDRAIAMLGNAVREYERSHESGWPAPAVGPMNEYLNLLMDAQKCLVAEEIVLRHIAKPENDGQREFFKHRLVDVYQRAYGTEQRVSLGDGEMLLKNVRQHLLTESERANEARKAHYLQAVVTLSLSAQDRHPQLARQFIREFAFEQLPGLIKSRPHDFDSLIANVVEALKTLHGARVALEFFIERMEQYPRSQQFGWNTPWQRHGHRISELRHEAGALGKYEARLLKLVLDELRADLRQRDNRSSWLFRKQDFRYWIAKEDEFIRVSEEVLAERPDSGQTAIYVAGYLYSLGRHDRAIEILFDFQKKGVLREQGLSQLVTYLHGRERFAESIGILEPLVARSPDTLWYRTYLMRAYHQTARPQMLAKLLQTTDEHFRSGGRWNENIAAELGAICTQTQLSEPAIDYLQEAIAMRLRDGQRREDWALWGYYRDLAAALTQLKRTHEAVEAAAAGVVMWPGHHHYRQSAIDNLVSTLRQAPDPDGYAKWLDEQAAQDHQERPLIRKSLGLAYRERGEHAKAVAQLRIAGELTPQDRELQRWLLESLDQLQQKDAALAQLKQLVELDPRNLDWHKQLAERLSSNEAEAERATTSIVEALPTEAESHQALAAIRESQNRWTEAIAAWQQVAELRSLEPQGLLGLANAQLKANQFDACDATLDRLTTTKWDTRFNTVKHQTEVLRAQLRAARKM